VLDLRVSNLGNSDLLINAVEFTVLESVHQMPMGQAGYSALYDLDISELEEFSSHAECRVAQILKPGEADRFGIVLSAPKCGLYAGWRLAMTFKTNYGRVSGPDVEIWVPRPKTLPTFINLKQHYISQFAKMAAQYPGMDPSQLIKMEVGPSGGFRRLFSTGMSVVWYCGPEPLLEPLHKIRSIEPP
jgi:hypothetical protein